jgi:hypothetical protein
VSQAAVLTYVAPGRSSHDAPHGVIRDLVVAGELLVRSAVVERTSDHSHVRFVENGATVSFPARTAPRGCVVLLRGRLKNGALRRPSARKSPGDGR